MTDIKVRKYKSQTVNDKVLLNIHAYLDEVLALDITKQLEKLSLKQDKRAVEKQRAKRNKLARHFSMKIQSYNIHG